MWPVLGQSKASATVAMGIFAISPMALVNPETFTTSPVNETIKQSSPKEHVSAWESNSPLLWMWVSPGSVAAVLFLFPL